MKNIDCFLKGIWRSLPQWLSGSFPIDGHILKDEEYHKGCDVIISRCEHCGKLDISWQGGQEVNNLEDLIHTRRF